MAWPKPSQNEATVQSIFDILFLPSRMYRSQLELLRDPKWVEVRRKGVLARTHLPASLQWWTPPRDGPLGNAMMMTYYIDAANAISGPKKPPIIINGFDVLAVWGYHCQVPPDDARKYREVVANFRKICDVVRPPFALVDHYTAHVKPHQKEDLRRRAWGATLYGPELVKNLGHQNLMTAPAYAAQETPWGAVWLQLAENPFDVEAKARKAVERQLGLKELEVQRRGAVSAR